MTFQAYYEDAVEVANGLWGGCDWLVSRED